MPRKSPQVKVNPKVISWARETAGWSLQQISTKLKVDIRTYQKWETGEQPPTLRVLEILAKYFKRPLSAFFLHEAPEEPPHPNDFRVLPRKPMQFERKTLLAIRRAIRLQSVSKELMQALQRGFDPQIGTASLSVAPEEVADQERKQLGITVKTQIDWKNSWEAFETWRQALERKNILVFRLSMPIDDARGFSLSGQVPFTIVVNSSDSITARSFTLFHEYAHLLLRRPGICIPRAELQRGNRSAEVERWCNQFSASLLLPKTVLQSEVGLHPVPHSPEELRAYLRDGARKFKVSQQVFLTSMLNLRLVSRRQYTIEMGRLQDVVGISKKGGYLLPEKKCLSENGRLFTSLVLEGQERGVITYRDVADYLTLPLKHLDKVQSLVAA